MRSRWLPNAFPELVFSLSIFLVFIGLFFIVRKARCKKEIEAILVNKEKMHAYRGFYYRGTFKFEYEGVEYQTDVNLGNSDRLAKFYIPKVKYKIYINPRKPKIAYIDNTVATEFFFLIFLGILVILVEVLK